MVPAEAVPAEERSGRAEGLQPPSWWFRRSRFLALSTLGNQAVSPPVFPGDPKVSLSLLGNPYFTLHDHVREEAQKYLRGLQVNGSQPSTFVGVHVRRGDYVHVMPQVWKGVVADRRYLEQALDWFRARYSSVVFVVTSNGMAWCQENIDASHGDVVFAGDGKEGSPAKDFALLTQCNHTVMTIGTFGIWAAYLAGGETIYLANYTLPDSPFLKVFKPEAAFLPEWIGIPADLSPLLKH
ncbi:galactoside alpha-(1,2)-fucosyltransferase 2-like [Equus quagga]|uniref:galactoside alpha-(1,2)-fucosyltransferase 2-like n=1 Tax=Equus quagga TaxID=89248 RepID=UPI001EE344FB|nr:galactoside alpha-(1,2)-fucosyltransferase 2-like [Equus quagga]